MGLVSCAGIALLALGLHSLLKGLSVVHSDDVIVTHRPSLDDLRTLYNYLRDAPYTLSTSLKRALSV